MCSCEDAEPCEVWCATWPVARKQHRCNECGGQILRGEKHLRVTGIFDREPFSSRRCPKCTRRANAFEDAEGCTAPLGGLLESIRECGREDPEFWSAYRAAMKTAYPQPAANAGGSR